MHTHTAPRFGNAHRNRRETRFCHRFNIHNKLTRGNDIGFCDDTIMYNLGVGVEKKNPREKLLSI